MARRPRAIRCCNIAISMRDISSPQQNAIPKNGAAAPRAQIFPSSPRKRRAPHVRIISSFCHGISVVNLYGAKLPFWKAAASSCSRCPSWRSYDTIRRTAFGIDEIAPLRDHEAKLVRACNYRADYESVVRGDVHDPRPLTTGASSLLVTLHWNCDVRHSLE